MARYIVWADGSGKTGGPAGIAFHAHQLEPTKTAEFSACRCLDDATNQQAEILAACYALHVLPDGSHVTVISDSEYLVKGYNEYLPYWMTHNWRKRSGGLPANLAYWQRLLRAVAKHETVVFSWTRGHVGTVGNETADKLAGKARLWREAAMVAV